MPVIIPARDSPVAIQRNYGKTGFVETGMNGSSHSNHENRQKNVEITRVPRLRASPRHGGARRFNLPDFINRPESRRGASFGAAGVHQNRGYGDINPHHRFWNVTIFMGNHLKF